MQSKDQLNPNFYCPITDELMKDPVIDHEGNSYERNAIEKWLSSNNTSPITRSVLTLQDLTPNRTLKNAIESEVLSGKLSVRLSGKYDLSRKGDTSNQAKSETKDSISNNSQAKDDDKMLIAPSKDDDGPELNDDLILTINAGKIERRGAKSDDDEEEIFVHTSAMFPDRAQRYPADICCVVDVSGSMGADASVAGAESGGLSLLDVVKHAVTTIINTLDDQDRLALVAYSSVATVIFELLPMTSHGRARATQMLQNLKAEGMTNLWDGLQKGLDLLKDGEDSRGGAGNSSILLLTDGVPNIEPPRGYVQMLDKYKERNNGKLPGTVTTFGFGYQLESILLRDLAISGGGAYAFIPDSGMVGTAFVNALSNVLATAAKDTILVLEPLNGARLVGDPLGAPLILRNNTSGVSISLGDLQLGQARDTVVKLSIPSKISKRNTTSTSSSSSNNHNNNFLVDANDGPYLRVTVNYRKPLGSEIYHVTKEGPSPSSAITNQSDDKNVFDLRQDQARQYLELVLQYFRSTAVDVFKAAHIRANRDRTNDLNGAKLLIQNLVDSVKIWHDTEGMRLRQGSLATDTSSSSPWVRFEALIEDLDGQVLQAFQRIEWYYKWGLHFIPSLSRAHQLQQCHNFKDPGVQHYGGRIFRETRDVADDVFCQLPPPTPTGFAVRAAAAAARPPLQHTASGGIIPAAAAPPVPAPVNMRSFNSRDNPCFHGDCLVRMADGSYKKVHQITKGDKINNGTTGTTTTSKDGHIDEIDCVIKTEISGGQLEMISLCSDDCIATSLPPLLITPWHPICMDQKWVFPHSIGSVKTVPCDAIYSFILKPRVTHLPLPSAQASRGIQISISGFAVAALAHGVDNDTVLSHDFFGTEKIVQSLMEGYSEGWKKGLIVLQEGSMIRNNQEKDEEESERLVEATAGTTASSYSGGRIIGLRHSRMIEM